MLNYYFNREPYVPENVSEIINEPMVFSAEPHFAYVNGGPLTRFALEHIFENDISYMKHDHDCIIDTRVNMLHPGWYPSIPGWHCDHIPRGEDGQPMFEECEELSMSHHIFVVDWKTGSLTQMLKDGFLEEHGKPDVKTGENVWGVYSDFINQHQEWPVETIQNGMIAEIGFDTFHRTMPATGSGWRFFFRASFGTGKEAANQIRKQSQVYLTDTDAGW